jgi:hypothetical protein
MRVTGWSRLQRIVGFAIVLLSCAKVYAGVTASILGTVTDPSGAAIQGATVTATNTDNGIAQTQRSNAQGFYSFQSLPLGHYDVSVQQAGFRTYRQTGLVLDVNAALVVDVSLKVGQVQERIEVSAGTLHVETATSQMGEVIEGQRITTVPLVSRSYTDLLALQPGVVSQPSGMTGAYAGTFISAGFALPQVSGDLNSGAQSVNGMREAANGFILNGAAVQETGFSGAGAIPNLDSIAEFRILTNNFDPEYGNYSGGQINVITKSGSNSWHGSAFEFVRNTSLDAANYFEAGKRGDYHQNQFGGTFGGPIKKDRLFFFADYQGNRKAQGIPQVLQGVPTANEIAGDFSGVAGQLTGTVGGDAWASQLTNRLKPLTGQTVVATEPYWSNTCTSTTWDPINKPKTGCVFPNAKFPIAAIDPISAKLLKYIQPASLVDPTTGATQFSALNQKLHLNDNKFSGRLDANTGYGLVSGYYYFDNYTQNSPYSSANQPMYPGFDVTGKGRSSVINLGDTKTIGPATVNEFRLAFFRTNVKLNQPRGGTGITLADLGFGSGANGQPGILPLAPSIQGVPEMDFNSFAIGVPSRPNQLVENIYQALDNFSKVIGTHTMKVGFSYHNNQLTEKLVNVANGNFLFGTSGGNVSETGVDFLDFLLGAPSQYIQGQSYPSYGRSFYFGAYGQDSWRIKPNLTLNYGLRWDVSSPWREKYNEIQTLIPGEQSVVFPGAPLGWVFPGDPRVPSTLAPTRWNNFAPRVGLAYSFGNHEGILGKVLGKSGSSSLRVGYGLFYTAFEGASNFNEIGDAPFGNFASQTGPTNAPTFADPFITRPSGVVNPQLFPVAQPPKNFSQKNPANFAPYNTLTNWLNAFGTIGSSPGFFYRNRLPYAENYELSLQRQITNSDLLTLSYVGTQGHRLLSSLSSNPGNPALCLSLSQAALLPTTPPQTPCGPGGENGIYTLRNGSVVLGTRAPFGGVVLPNGTGVTPFANNAWFITSGNSVYNSAQVNWRHTSGRAQLLLGYTFSKAIDNSSGYGEQINPVNRRITRGLSAFDSTNNFVISYSYQLPFDKLGGPKKLMGGWEISGITRFSTGLPVTLVETDDQSLLGTSFGGPITLPVDTPNFNGRSVGIADPRKSAGHFYFNPAAFSQAALGTEGTANRRFFHGPGVNNWDMALLKDTHFNERLDLQFRAEFFNIFNHTQFGQPSGVVGSFALDPTTGLNLPTGSFGQVNSAAPPRIAQLGLKLNF